MSRAVLERPRVFYPSFERRAPGARATHYCPGCGHGLVAKYLAEAIDGLGAQDRTILLSSVGCSLFSYYYLDVGNVQVSHGRAPAVATGIKRARPDALVVAIQGDGDLAAIGLAEIVHAANRGEALTILFVNNAVYGMTGGQMAPTTLLGQVTTTSPAGRQALSAGYPLHVCELLDTLRAPARIERVSLGDARSCVAARRAVREALRWQMEGRGFSFLEILSPCPVGWSLSPVEARRHVRDSMAREFPPRLLRQEEHATPAGCAPFDPEAVERTAAGGGMVDEEAGAASATAPQPLPGFPADPAFKLSGFGGQGVLSTGLILAEAGRRSGYEVSWLPSYGPEMRGGTAHCHVRLARHPIGSPIVERPDVLVAMNAPSLVRFEGQVKPGGMIVLDSTLAPDGSVRRADVRWLTVPATAEAESAGEPRAGGIVALGALAARTGILPREALQAALAAAFHSPAARERNQRALQAGWAARSCTIDGSNP